MPCPKRTTRGAEPLAGWDSSTRPTGCSRWRRACYQGGPGSETPNPLPGRITEGVLAAGRGDLDTAGAAFKAAAELAPRDVPIKIRLADLELDRGNVEAGKRLV